MSIIHSLWVSKLRYGLQLCTKVYISTDDKKSSAMKALQLTQNRMLRAINGTKIKNKITIQSMLTKFKLLSVNQLSAQIKLIETWKSVHVEGNPLKLDPYLNPKRNLTTELRPSQRGSLMIPRSDSKSLVTALILMRLASGTGPP